MGHTFDVKKKRTHVVKARVSEATKKRIRKLGQTLEGGESGIVRHAVEHAVEAMEALK